MLRIGIRQEDKSGWEARVPLVPEDVGRLIGEHGLEFCVQSSPIRVFTPEQYVEVGAVVADDLADCPVIMGVKEIPPDVLEPDKTYVFFSHTIKGQPANMPMLRRLMELRCQLVDYERIIDAQGQRLVFFGRYAGLAGMIDTLWALGQRLDYEGIESPFGRIRQARRYDDLAQALADIAAVGEAIRQEGLAEALRPLVCGLTGYGQVSQGAQEVYDLLPVREIAPDELPSLPRSANTCYKVVFREEHLVEPTDGSKPFDLQEYYDHPERYRARFFPSVQYLTLLVNCVYWEPKYPRLVTCEQLGGLYGEIEPPRLRVIGDISCDVQGSVECTVRTTDAGDPVYVYDPGSGAVRSGVAGDGPVVLAVDALPCGLPVDSSQHFSRMLSPWIPSIAAARFEADLADSGLPLELQRATILYHGELTEPYRYMTDFVR
ncbi:MAG: bifunctional lysine ketoglutarate reductase /saccharopine dehydrogenase family protein [Planctomycetota bacterium]|jgi:alpha-aminoadipic semialdehyde synthase